MAEVTEVIIKKVELKKLRKQANLSLRKLSELSGVSYSLLSNYENENIRMRSATWDKIVAVLDKNIK